METPVVSLGSNVYLEVKSRNSIYVLIISPLQGAWATEELLTQQYLIPFGAY